MGQIGGLATRADTKIYTPAHIQWPTVESIVRINKCYTVGTIRPTIYIWEIVIWYNIIILGIGK